MKKVLHIIRTHSVAGAENHLFMLLPALVKTGLDINLLTLTDGHKGKISDGYRQKLEQMKCCGIKVIEETVRNKYDFTEIQKIKMVIQKIKPEIVHTHLPYADLFGAIAAKKAGAACVVSSRHHDYSFSSKEKRKFSLYYSIANRWNDRVIAISSRVAQQCTHVEGWPENKVDKVLYGCEDQRVDKLEARKTIESEFKLCSDNILLGTVARLIPLKGHQYAIDALHELVKNNKRIVWMFAGDGPVKERLSKEAEKKGVRDNILFLGHRTDIPQLMAAFDILVHPTTGEGFGLIFLEAMIQSTPVVSTRTGAIPEIVLDNETGVIVDSRDGYKLAQGLQKLIENRDLRIDFGERGRKRYEQHFTVERMAEETEKVYVQQGL